MVCRGHLRKCLNFIERCCNSSITSNRYPLKFLTTAKGIKKKKGILKFSNKEYHILDPYPNCVF